MADEFLAASVEQVIRRLISLGVEEIRLLVGVKKEVNNLRSLLTNIQVVLNDAEKRNVEEEAVTLWLNDLKQVAYDAEDILDEIAYEDSKRRAEKSSNTSIVKSKVQNFFSSNNPLVLHCKIAHKIKNLNQKFDYIAKRKDKLKLRSVEPNHPPQTMVLDRETSSFVNDSAVVGRDEDKLKIVDMLIGCHGNQDGSSSSSSSSTTNISVIPIVGLGGLGKTTVAQLVYNDKEVLNHFDLRIWICVSDNFVTTTLLSQILKQTSNHEDGQIRPSLQELQTKVQKELSGKKFLLVLDDVWDEDHDSWENFNLSLRNSVSGSKILVTTRSTKVASNAWGSWTLEAYSLQVLSEDKCWELFERRAFEKGGPERTSNLVAIGKEIVRKCGGVPLAVKTLGSLMHSKREEHEWSAIANSEIWNISDKQNKIMEVLKLSYKNLRPEVKQCFSYCAIFPKDYEIKKETLIQLWMAQGFLKASGGHELMEDIGDIYFNILHSNSFFQEVKKFEDTTVCKMHDLVHDLAQSITKFECRAMKATETLEDDLSRFCHLSLITSHSISTIPKALHKAKKMRTFSLVRPSDGFYMDHLNTKTLGTFFKLRFFRALDLSTMSIKELPSSIGELKHLRYLNLSSTNLEELPQSITRLYNLQTLKLEECYGLRELPKNLRKLINLRHLCIDSKGEWEEMPSKMGQLLFLQTCPIFKVDEEEGGCSNIAELGSLSLLRGSLNIYKLENVKDVMSAKRANLNEKKRIDNLMLKWSDTERDGDHHDYYHQVAAVLEVLQPHSNLKKLLIEGFKGVKFPRWLTSGSALSNLAELFLNECNQCEHITSLGKLPCVKRLLLCSMRNMKHLGGSWNGNTDCNACQGIAAVKEEEEVVEAAYPNLKQLTLGHMPNLEEWLENVFPQFACLEELTIWSCPKLRKTPNSFPSLKNLDFRWGVGGMAVTSITSNNHPTSLTSLTVGQNEDLTFLPEGLLRNNSHLECLIIYNCPRFQGFVPNDNEGDEQERVEVSILLGALRQLELIGCPSLTSMPNMKGLTSLEDLKIQSCDTLKLYATQFSSLRRMSISGMNKLSSITSLFTDDILENSKHLQSIQIGQCCSKFQGTFLSFQEMEQQVVLPPSLELLQIRGCSGACSVDLRGLICLRELTILNCGGLKSLSGLQYLTALQKLSLGPFSEELDCFPFTIEENIHLHSLRYLEIIGWYNLKSLPNQLQYLSSISALRIDRFNGLMELPEWFGKLTSLQKLHIDKCENLMHLPSVEEMQQLTSLSELYISNCPLLQERCTEAMGGAEWHKISHISLVKFGAPHKF